jgi:8-oxo-dGTP diphosphatase
MRPIVDVVAAVITRADGTYLLAQRPPGKVYEGYWEFPGGKVEPGETAPAAIRREIREELGIEVVEALPWLMRRHEYEHASVRLRFFRVTQWTGDPRGLEGQAFVFQSPGRETVSPMLPANGPVLKALALPMRYGITPDGAAQDPEFPARLEEALSGGLRLLQVRDKGLDRQALANFASRVLARCRVHGARMLLNGDTAIAAAIGADGLHLTSRQLRLPGTGRPDFPLVGVSTHDMADLACAHAMGCDFAVLGPLRITPTHPDATPLGWEAFAAAAASAELPVYALGGMMAQDLRTAIEHGAHGIAMIRDTWLPDNGANASP